jgi:hypothetical protein
MRDYSKVSPLFWTGDTGRALRKSGRDAQVVALYLLTGPNANMIGLYELPLPLLAHHTGMTFEGASKGLRRASEGGFCHYDEASETVWIPEMARFQIGETIAVKDNRHKAIVKEWLTYKKSPYFLAFHARYATCFDLPDASPFEGASKGLSKPLRSQEQEQEQEQEQKQEQKKDSSEPGVARSEPTIAEPSLMEFPVVGDPTKTAWPLTESHVAKFREAYPDADVIGECRKALLWCEANKSKRKTAKGMPAFLARWFSQSADRPKAPAAKSITQPFLTARDNSALLSKEIIERSRDHPAPPSFFERHLNLTPATRAALPEAQNGTS